MLKHCTNNPCCQQFKLQTCLPRNTVVTANSPLFDSTNPQSLKLHQKHSSFPSIARLSTHPWIFHQPIIQFCLRISAITNQNNCMIQLLWTFGICINARFVICQCFGSIDRDWNRPISGHNIPQSRLVSIQILPHCRCHDKVSSAAHTATALSSGVGILIGWRNLIRFDESER